jgi:hypothetical protein
MLEIKDLIGFLTNISVAVEVSRNDLAMLKKATFLMAEGLYKFQQHRKALEWIEEALKYNDGNQAFELLKYKGKVLGFLGEVSEAERVFKKLIQMTDDVSEIAGLCINIAWARLSIDKDTPLNEKIEEVKYYLDMANQYFDQLPNEKKWKLCNNYSVYYYYKGAVNQAIELLNTAVQYCSEEDLAYVYGNLAETYLSLDDEDTFEIIHEYTEKAEIIGTKYGDNVAVARAFYTKAMAEVRSDQLFTALDTLYIAFEYYTKAEAYPLAFECLVQINELMNDYKVDRLRSLQNSLKAEFNGTPYFSKL